MRVERDKQVPSFSFSSAGRDSVQVAAIVRQICSRNVALGENVRNDKIMFVMVRATAASYVLLLTMLFRILQIDTVPVYSINILFEGMYGDVSAVRVLHPYCV